MISNDAAQVILPDERQTVSTKAIDRAFSQFVKDKAVKEGYLDSESANLLEVTALLLSTERGEGNSCIDLREWASQTLKLVGVAITIPDVDRWRGVLLNSSVCSDASEYTASQQPSTLLVLDKMRLYMARYFIAEFRLATLLQQRLSASPNSISQISTEKFRKLFGLSQNTSGDINWQALAAVSALRSSVSFITGGPGTGKTTVAARLLALLLDSDASLRIAVAAPTGRAAARLSEAIGAVAQREALNKADGSPINVEGKTLHRLLGYHTATQRFRFNAEHPLIEDIVIVDEASMIDILMMKALVEALKPSAKLVVLGDPDQLASVDTGFVLADVSAAAELPEVGGEIGHSSSLMNAYFELAGASSTGRVLSERVSPLQDAVVRLKTSWRFGPTSGIGRVASAVRMRRSEEALEVLRSVEFPDATLTAEALTPQSLLHPVEKELELLLHATSPDQALNALSRFRVLTGLREGPHGVSGINATIEGWLRRRGMALQEWYDYRPILITANDVSTRLFNGDVGVVMAVDGVPMVHFLRTDGSVYSQWPGQLPAHETAWAITVHKSQGSEYDKVVFVLPDIGNRLLNRELIYTAVTRAREAVTIFGDAKTLADGIGRTVQRSSGLAERLQSER